jgi:hypothetical protein
MKPEKTYRLLPALLIALTASAAASAAGPVHPTAVTRAKIEISGHILPASHQQLVSYTRPDRRLNDYHVRMDAWWARMLMRHASHTGDLFRLDHEQAYKVFYDKHEYYQCQVAGCPSLWNLIKRFSAHHEDKDSTYDPNGTDTCPLTPTRHDIVVKDTGQTRTIDGYLTHHYRATFTAVFADRQQRTDTNTLQIDFWTTPPSGAIRQVWNIDQQALDRYMKEVSPNVSPLARYVPRDIFRALGAFIGDTDAHAHAWHQRVAQQLATIPGFPVDLELNWFVDAKACPQQSADHGAEAAVTHNPLGALRGMLGHAVEKRIAAHFTPAPNTPVFHYSREITQVDIEPVADSVFDVPANFTRKPLPKGLAQDKADGANGTHSP